MILVVLLELVTVFNLFDYSLFETLILYRTTGSNSQVYSQFQYSVVLCIMSQKGVQTQFTEDHVPLIINNKTDYVICMVCLYLVIIQTIRYLRSLETAPDHLLLRHLKVLLIYLQIHLVSMSMLHKLISTSYRTNSKYILSIAIAPLYSVLHFMSIINIQNITLKMKSQQLVIFNLMRFPEHIRLLVFTSDPYWIQFCRQHQINYTTDIRHIITIPSYILQIQLCQNSIYEPHAEKAVKIQIRLLCLHEW